ncbi:MAG: two-component system response regulator [Methylophilaceae bacterium]|nr:MAG: two-component system response regulator [Methylophilaceae bacterium]
MLDIPLLEKSSILVVDDQSTSRTILSHVVRSINPKITIIEKNNPEKALEWATENTADLVFVDYVMPEMNGVDFTSLLKKIPSYDSVPVIMITIKKDAGTRYEALDAGVADFLSKPVDVYECTARCKNLLTMRQQQLKLQSRGDKLEDEVKRAVAEISAREKETLMRLARAGEHKDSITATHLQRMSLYSKAIAEAAGFNEDDAEIIELAAPLHDIGKIGIPDNILLKKGPLTEEEMTIMRQHALIGYEILQNSPSKYLQMGGEIALAHHERYDGLGYPYQLKGNQIPISARIVAIADVLDALTSQRPYKEAWTMSKAFEYLETESGKHFDPDLIATTVSIRETIENIFDKQTTHIH